MGKKMGKYCKAYPLERFAEYPGWAAAVKPVERRSETGGEEGAAAEELSYAFLQEDYTVTAGIFLEEEVMFDAVCEEWKAFCTETLGFEPPSWEPVAAGAGSGSQGSAS